MIGKKINQLATELAPVSTDLTIIGDPISGVSKKITLAQLGAIFSGAVSFYTNLAGFPATGDINVIYCAKDTQKLYLWSGSAYVEVFPSQALLDTYQLRSEKGVSNGYASLDSAGKVPISQLPSSIMEYKGTWNAATNTPTLANGTGDTGDVYICNVAGTVNFGAGAITFAVGDYVIYSGSIWQRSSGAVGTVTSVAASITGNAIGITGSPVTTSGTLAFAFAGTGAQYIKGDGTLATFPSTIAQAERLITEVYNSTGATLTKGTIVYINGGQGNLPTVTKALATGDSTSAQTFGIVQADITNNNNGYVVVAGKLSDLDTQAYTEGTQLYLSATTAGTWTSTKQYAPNHLVYIGIVVRAHPTQGIVEIKIQNGYELDELHNVAAQNPDNNDILQYKTSTSLWTKVAGTTSNIAEGSNLYYTDARSRAALSFTAGSGAYNSTTGVITIPTNTNQLTNGAAYITLASLSASSPLSYNNTTGAFSISQANSTTNGFLSSTDWNTFNSKQAGLNGTGFVKISGTTISYDNSTYYLASNPNSYIALTNLSAGAGISYNNTTGVIASTITQYTDAMARASISGGTGISYNSTTGVITNTITQYTDAMARASISLTTTGTSGAATYNSTTGVLNVPQYAPDLSGYVPTSRTLTINGTAFDLSANRSWSVGTVTSVGLSSATSGVTIGSTPITSSGTITLAIATASGSQQGLLSSTDWTTFNNKQNALTNPVTGTGTTNYLPKFTGASTIGNSIVQESGSSISVAGSINISGNFPIILNSVTGVSSQQLQYQNNGTNKWQLYLDTSNNSFNFFSSANAANRLTLTEAGNLGLGITPSAWGGGGLALQVSKASLWSFNGNNTYLGNNYFLNSSTQRIYIANGLATEYAQINGVHIWYTAPSGTAGNTISFTQAMTLNASGNLSIGNTNNTYRLDVSGSSMTRGTLVIDNNGTDTSPTEYIRFERNSQGSANYFNSIFSSTGSGTNLMQFRLSNTSGGQGTVMTLTGTGNVGIGTTSPNRILTVYNSNAATLYQTPTSGTGANDGFYVGQVGDVSYVWNYNSFPLAFGTAATERMRITSGGNLLVGKTTNAGGKLQVSNGTITFNVDYNADGAYLTAATDNNVNYRRLSYDATDHVFLTSATERMRITSGGLVGIGTSSVNDKFVVVGGANIWTGRFDGSSTSSQSYGIVINAGTNSNDSSLLVRNYNGSSTYLNIRGDGQATFSGDVKVKTLEVTNATTYGSSAGISTYMQITVNGNNYVIPLHGTP